MIIIIQKNCTESQKKYIKKVLQEKGFNVKEIKGQEEIVLGAVGQGHIDKREVEVLPGVDRVIPISKPYKLASRELKKEDTVIKIGKVQIGGNRIVAIAGPCAIESRKQIMTIAQKVREAGAVILRGGAFKPRTSPYSFQGLKEQGLEYLKEAGLKYEMPVVSEIVNPSNVSMMKNYVDMFQIGARNMQNFELLKEVGNTGMPVLLKRGISATIEEWLMAAEYLMSSGTDNVILCERGIRTYETATRNTLDCSAIPLVQKLTHLPVIGDPSHATGKRDLVSPMSLALIASGAHGISVEVHDNPSEALSDGAQSLYPSQFAKLMKDITVLCPVVDKNLERIPLSKHYVAAKNENVPFYEVSIAFQGERGAFSELASKRVFGNDCKLFPMHTFKEVFDAIKTKQVKYGVVPIENTLGGTINDNVDLMIKNPEITVVNEIPIRIIHNLITIPGTKIEDIKKVYSHPQALAQCSDFLQNELSYAEPLPFFDTAGAVSYIKQLGNKENAAIAGTTAAEVNKMEILKDSIETNPMNYTRFYVICLTEEAEEIRSAYNINKMSVTFSVEDRPGTLFEALEILSKNNLNMKKLESRPIEGKPWEYRFFMELTTEDIDKFWKASEEMKKITRGFRVLGVFEESV